MNVTVVGNLCADPELRRTSGGVAVADLRMGRTATTKTPPGNGGRPRATTRW